MSYSIAVPQKVERTDGRFTGWDLMRFVEPTAWLI
jgi:hypothetical protein